MNGYDTLLQYIGKQVVLTEEEKEQLANSCKETRIQRKQFIIQPNFVARYRYFVLQGAMRAYVIDEEGQEHTIQLAIENWWISDYNSYIFQQPASMFVVAVEETQALQISFEEEQKLKAASHTFETFFRMLAERSVAFMQRRIISNLTQTAGQRYDLFTEKYPLMSNRFPQYVIASYLGMTTEFLSKIRNQKVKRKT